MSSNAKISFNIVSIATVYAVNSLLYNLHILISCKFFCNEIRLNHAN